MPELVPLGKIADIIGGFAFRSKDFAATGFPVVKIAEIDPPRVNLEACQRIPANKVGGLDKYRLQDRDIVMAMTGATIGKAGRIRSSEVAYLNQRVAKISAKAGADYDDFIYAVVSQRGFDEEVLNQSNGSAQANVSTDGIGRILVPAFSQNEQKAIAAVLGTLDDKIELNRRMNATLEATARALFQSCFVDFDPVRAKLDCREPIGLSPATAALFPNEFEDSELGCIPKGWAAGKLGDIGTNLRRGVRPNEIAANTPYIALEHMPRRCIALSVWDESADVASGKSAFKKGEILFGKLRPYFHKVGVAPFDGVCSTDILVIAPKAPEWFGFLLGHLSSDELINFTDLASTGTKMPRTNWSDISSFKVAIPPAAVAALCTEFIQPMIERITANCLESRTLAALRDTLLPKLLSGELNLHEGTRSYEHN